MAQQTVEVASVRRTDDPLVTSRTDDGLREYSPADSTKPCIVSKRRSQHPTVAAPRPPSVEALAQDHLDHVVAIARSVVGRLPPGVDIDDLIADGNVGLVTAARAFTAARGIPFKTFAKYRIRGAMIDGLRAFDPRSRYTLAQHRAVEQAISLLANLLGRFPTEEEIAESMGLDEERWRELRRCLYAAGYRLMLDSFPRAAPEPDTLPGTTTDPESLTARAALRAMLDDALLMIPTRCRTVINLYYLTGWTMKEIAMRLGVNESRVSQIHKRAIAILRTQLDEATYRYHETAP